MPVVPQDCPEARERTADLVEVESLDDEESPDEPVTAEHPARGEIREMPVLPEHPEPPETEETMA